MKLKRGNLIYTNAYSNAFDLYGNAHINKSYEKWWVLATKQKYTYWNKDTERLEYNDVLLQNALSPKIIIRINSRYILSDTRPMEILKKTRLATTI